MQNQLLSLLQQQLNDDNFVNQLSNQIGGADQQQTKLAANGIMTTLMEAMARNASTQQGASNLANALDRDHDGSILDDVIGLLSGNKQAQNPNMLNGAGILQHLLGGKQGGIINVISQLSGLDNNKTGNLMQMLAPVLMGMLGKTKKEQGLDVNNLQGLLQNTVQTTRKQQPVPGGNKGMDMLTRLLDQDGDGDITKEAMNIGKGLLSRFLGRK